MSSLKFLCCLSGTVHSDDLQFVFGRAFLWDNPGALNHSGIALDDTVYTDYDRHYSRFMMTLWTNFAKYGYSTTTLLFL